MDSSTVAIGVGAILVTLDAVALTQLYQLTGEVGEDAEARESAAEALSTADRAHARLDRHIDAEHDDLDLDHSGDSLRADGGSPPRDDETGRFLSPSSWHGRWERFTSRLPLTFDMDDVGGDTDGRTGFLSTYPEVHAVGWGLGLGLSLGLSLAYGKGATLAAGAALLRTVHYAHTGKVVQILGGTLGLPKRYRSQLRREPQYLDAAAVLGLVLGTAFVHVSALGFWW